MTLTTRDLLQRVTEAEGFDPDVLARIARTFHKCAEVLCNEDAVKLFSMPFVELKDALRTRGKLEDFSACRYISHLRVVAHTKVRPCLTPPLTPA